MIGLRRAVRTAVDLNRAAPLRQRPGIGSPWAPPSDLAPIVIEDVFGIQTWPISRAEAMSIPAIARARNLLCGLIGRLNMQAVAAGTTTPIPGAQPSWIARTDTIQPAYQRAVWTTDDLIFYGESLWLLERGASGGAALGPVLRADHVPFEDWAVTDDLTIELDGVPVPEGAACYFAGTHEGILNFGARSVRAAADLDRDAADTARSPFKLELKQTAGDPLSATERADLIGAARQALADNNGVLFTNQSVEAIVHEYTASALLLEGRNFAAIDMARLVGVPAATIDAVLSGSGITYQTGPSLDRALIEYGAAMYLAPISARLSQNDICPNGQAIAFDVEALIGPMAPTSDLTPTTTEVGTA